MAARYLSKIVVFFSFTALMLTASGAEAGGSTLGDVMTNAKTSFSNFPSILNAIAYISGIFLAAWGIFKFKDHVDNPNQTHISEGVKRFLAGGMMLSAPYMGSAAYGSLIDPGSNLLSGTSRHGSPGGGGMDQMIFDLMADVAGPMEKLLIAFSYIAAIALLLVGISRLTKTMQEGPRGPAGMGTLMTFLAAGALFAFGDMMGTFSSSLFGSATTSTYASISPDVISDAASADKVAAVIEAVMLFVMLVGYIAFIRGWFVLKAFADGGNTNASVAQALTFLFGGALAINLGDLVNVLQTTVGVNGITFS